MTQRLEEFSLRHPAVGSRIIRDHLTLRGDGVTWPGRGTYAESCSPQHWPLRPLPTAIDAPSASVEAATTTCGPLGRLKTYQLNDRCNYGLLDLSLVTDAVVVDVLDGVGLFATLTRLH